MEPLKLGKCRRRDSLNRVAIAAGVGFTVLWFAAPGMAADSMSGLGAAFRPQTRSDVAAHAAGQRDQGNLSGLRVVVSGAGQSVASIDGRTVHVGDNVNGMRVTRISEQGVVLTGEGGVEQRLTINPPSVIKSMQPVKAMRDSNGATR
jgi:hypothetical protein